MEAAGERTEGGSFFQRHGRRDLQRILGAGYSRGACLPDGTVHEPGVFLIAKECPHFKGDLYSKGCFIFYLGESPFISFLRNKILDNAHNAHYNMIKRKERRDAMNE